MHLLKHHIICCQKRIYQSIHQRVVKGDAEDDGFGEEEKERAGEVFAQEEGEGYLDLFLLGVDSPVLGCAAQERSFANEDRGRVGFMQECKIQQKTEEADDRSQILCPSPSQTRGCDEPTDKRRHQGSEIQRADKT